MTARHLTASAIVLDGSNRALLVHHVKSGLRLHPGHIERGEDPAQAALRETAEETGVSARIVTGQLFTHPAVTAHPTPFAVIQTQAADPVAGPHQHVDFRYVFRPTSESTLAPRAGEVTAARWAEVSEMERLDVPPELAALTASAIRWAGSRMLVLKVSSAGTVAATQGDVACRICLYRSPGHLTDAKVSGRAVKTPQDRATLAARPPVTPTRPKVRNTSHLCRRQRHAYLRQPR
jgi:8-oxo-dGTP pyrophosphatase MutT (NUDIX family)